LKNTLNYQETQNKYLLYSTKALLSDYKSDYIKLIEILKEKDREILLKNNDLKLKKDSIFLLQDRLLSVNVLEKKITILDEKFTKDTEKLKENYDKNLKKHYFSVKNDPLFNHKIKENTKEIGILQKKIVNESLEKSRIIGDYERKMGNLKKNNKNLMIENYDISKQLSRVISVKIDDKKEDYLFLKYRK